MAGPPMLATTSFWVQCNRGNSPRQLKPQSLRRLSNCCPTSPLRETLPVVTPMVALLRRLGGARSPLSGIPSRKIEAWFTASIGRSRVMSYRPASLSYQFFVAVLLSGCASVPTSGIARAAAPCPCDRPHALVLVAAGAGNFRGATATLGRAASEADAPLCVEPFVWSHGYCRILADQMGREHMREEGKRLAEVVLAHRRQDPATPIYLVGHSAGSGIVL